MSKKIVITGVAGFLGRSLAHHFFVKGWNVIGVDMVAQENSPSSVLKKYLSTNLPNSQFVDLLDEVQPDVCLHCAGRSSVGVSILKPYEDYLQGPALTSYVLNSLHTIQPECKFIFFSSAAVYGNPPSLPISEEFAPSPISPYGFHKWQSEILCREYSQVYKQPIASVRIFSAYGPGLRRQVLWDICEKASTEKVVYLHGTGKESRDFIHSYDVVRGVECVINSAEMVGESYNLANGDQITIAHLSNLILDFLHLKDKEIIFDYREQIGNPLNWQADISKISKLGFSPTLPFEKGLQSYVNWYLSEWSRG